MKKFWILGLATLLVIPFTSACSVSNEYKVLHNELVSFTTDDAYAEFFNGDIQFYDADLQRNSGLQTDKADLSSHFGSITYYEQVIKMALSNIKNFSGPFESVPTYNTGLTKKLCSNVLTNINLFKQQVEKFNVKKENMIFQYKLSQDTAGVQTYNDFKSDLGKLAESANTLQVSFINTLTALYYPFEQDIESISPSRAECGVAKTFSTLINDYFKYAILENKYEHPNTVCELYYTLTLQLAPKLEIENPQIKTENFATWLAEYKLFKNEHNMFSCAIKNVDMTKNYDDLSGAKKSYYSKVMHYVDYHNGINSNSTKFISRTIELLY